MILGMTTFTFIHVAISLLGLASGLIVTIGLLQSKRMDGWTAAFLLTTVLTSVTGFGFAAAFGPSHVVGIISLVVLLVAVLARYPFHLAGSWRWVYVISALVAFYFNVFVLVVQLFRKVPSLTALAPTQSEPPFAIAQTVVLLVFIGLGYLAVKAFRPGPALT